MKFKQNLALLVWLYRSKASAKDRKAPIYVRLTIDGDEDEISLGKKVLPEFWDNETKSVTEGTQEAKQINKKISAIRVDIERIFESLLLQHDYVTPRMVKNVYQNLPHDYVKGQISKEKVSLVAATDYVITRFSKMVDKGKRSAETLKKWYTTKNKITEFLDYSYKKSDIPLSTIKYAFAEDFYDYLTLDSTVPIQEATAKKYLKNTKHVLKTAARKEWIVKNPIEDFVCGGDETDIPPLELVQVQALIKKNLPITRLAEVRDAYIFQCFTGFAYQDIYALSPDHIVNVGISGERWLIKERGKTEVSEMVPILPIVEKLIKKYSDHPYCKLKNRLMPINSNTRYNGYLKEIATIAGINRDLNTHLARHTFADIMLNSGVPLEDVSKMLGHKSIRTTQRYCKVRKNRISENMNKAKTILFTKTGQLKNIAV